MVYDAVNGLYTTNVFSLIPYSDQTFERFIGYHYDFLKNKLSLLIN